MNNDADQKPKWREWQLIMTGGTTAAGHLYPQQNFIGPEIFEQTTVIEALPALAEIESLRAELRDERAMQSFGYKESKAEIESLRAENAELKERLSEMSASDKRTLEVQNNYYDRLTDAHSKLKTKLTAAAAQMEKMAYALKAMIDSAKENNCGLRIADEALAQYEQFKKETL